MKIVFVLYSFFIFFSGMYTRADDSKTASENVLHSHENVFFTSLVDLIVLFTLLLTKGLGSLSHKFTAKKFIKVSIIIFGCSSSWLVNSFYLSIPLHRKLIKISILLHENVNSALEQPSTHVWALNQLLKDETSWDLKTPSNNQFSSLSIQ